MLGEDNIQEWAGISDVNPAECDENDVVQLIYDYQRMVKRHICISPDELKAAAAEMIDNAYYLIYKSY